MGKILLTIVCTILFSSTIVQLTYAALGGNRDSISDDQRSLHARSHKRTSKTNYSVEEITTDATTVREYVTSSGIIFALTWNGHTHPDLQPLLGTYSTEYAESHNKMAKNNGKRRQKLATQNIIVEKWGHMRNLKGRAYVPNLLPSGVTIEDLQ